MCYVHLIRLAYLGQSDLCGLTRHFLLDFRRPVQPDSRPVATSEHISTGAKPGKIHRFFSRLFDWLISDGRAAKLEKEELRLDARAVACRVGERGGMTEWRVVIQVRLPNTERDNVASIHWASRTPPHVSDVLRHFQRKPQDFRFIDYLPNAHTKASTDVA